MHRLDASLTILMSTVGAADPTSGPTSALPGVLLVIGIVLLGFILMVSIRGKVARRQAATPPARARIEAIKANAAGRDNVEATRADLVDLARRLAAQLDVKAARLEQLIVQADDRIAALRRDAAGAGPPDDWPPGPQSQEPTIESPRAADPATPAATRAAPVDPLTAAVYELADGGRGPVEIAQELEEQIGKVELILALRED